MTNLGAIVLAGGGARRLGGQMKPAVRVGGVRMIDRVLVAVGGADPIIVVGPAALDVPSTVIRIQEAPPGGGPVAAIGAAFVLPALRATFTVTVVAGDLPLLQPTDIERLTSALAIGDDGALFVDADGRQQWLCGVWRTAAIDERLASFGTLAGGALRKLFAPMRIVEVRPDAIELPPFYDCDTDDDIRRVEEWLRR